ncbi:type III polyketide synthase [Halobacteriovorax marinus]|uniref:type III polyketide synthase n=1 Tax=Halobacteriovorax marinus TaxID=97084 RepID=UPI003A8CAF0E
MSYILSSKTVFPKYHYSQSQIVDFLSTLWPKKKNLLAKFSKNVCVDNRSLCITTDEVMRLDSFAMRNDIWKREAIPLVEKSIELVLKDTGVSVEEIDQFITTSVTGFCIPSLDTVIMNKMKFNPRTKRLPLFGFGCLGGVASLNRAHDYLQLNKKGIVLISAVELCSLTFQMQDKSIENLIGTSLFGDGAASVIMVGEEHPLAKKSSYEIVDYDAFFYENSADTMGWDIKDSGFKLVLNKNVSELVNNNIPDNLMELLDKARVRKEDIKFSISHPGGPKVLEAMQDSLDMKEEDFSNSWKSLREHGNMSSVSVLNVLEQSIDDHLGKEGDLGVMAAMGPGFNSEITIIKKK